MHVFHCDFDLNLVGRWGLNLPEVLYFEKIALNSVFEITLLNIFYDWWHRKFIHSLMGNSGKRGTEEH